jgi:hypothetical protein
VFHTVAYSINAGAAASNTDMTAAVDTVLTTRNNHLIFTDDFRLGLAYGLGQTITDLRFNSPTLNTYFRHHVWPLDTGAANPATVPDRPALVDYLNQMIQLPQNEEIALEVSNGAAANERDSSLLWLFTPDHQFSIPGGIMRLVARATYGITTAAAFAWSGAGVFTFAENLRGGWYSVVGFNVFDASTLAARLIFPRARQYNGRVMRPGTLVQNATGNRPDRLFGGKLGAWGKFHSFEPVQVEIFSNTAALHNAECRLDLVYHGDAEPMNY